MKIKKILIGLALLAPMSSFAEQPFMNISKVKHASEQAMDQFVETDEGKNLIENNFDEEEGAISIKHFSYIDSVSNQAKMHASYYIVVEENGKMNVYLCDSKMKLKILGENIFTLISSKTKCLYQHLKGEGLYKP